MILDMILIWIVISIAIDYLYTKYVINIIRKSAFLNPTSIEFLERVIKNENNEYKDWIVELGKYHYIYVQIGLMLEKLKSKFKRG